MQLFFTIELIVLATIIYLLPYVLKDILQMWQEIKAEEFENGNRTEN